MSGRPCLAVCYAACKGFSRLPLEDNIGCDEVGKSENFLNLCMDLRVFMVLTEALTNQGDVIIRDYKICGGSMIGLLDVGVVMVKVV